MQPSNDKCVRWSLWHHKKVERFRSSVGSYKETYLRIKISFWKYIYGRFDYLPTLIYIPAYIQKLYLISYIYINFVTNYDDNIDPYSLFFSVDLEGRFDQHDVTKNISKNQVFDYHN